MMVKRTVFVFFIYTQLQKSASVSVSNLLPFGLSYGGSANEHTVNIHGQFTNATLLDWYSKLTIPPQYSSFRIFGATLPRDIFINFNGHVTFGSNYNSFAPVALNETNRAIIAIFFSDNDLRRADGFLHYRFTTDIADLTYAQNLTTREGFDQFNAQYCIVATWENVKFYVANPEDRDKPNAQSENTYQVILCTDGNEGHAIFQYAKLEWSRSQDTTTKQAQAGWYIPTSTDEQNRHYAIPFTGTANILSIINGSNTREPGTPGRWMRSLPLQTGLCATKNDGVYAVNCTTFYFCCGRQVEKMEACPTGSVFHPFSGYCVERNLYPCGGHAINFCDGRADGRYENPATNATNDYYQCTKQLTRLHTCPEGIMFNTGNARCTQ